MNKEKMEILIADILRNKEEIERLEYNIDLAKNELMKGMEEQGLFNITTDQGKASIRSYSVTRYDSENVRMMVSKLRKKQQVTEADIARLTKRSDVHFIVVTE